LRNLYESTEIATIFLDRELIIRSYTPAVTRIFNLIPSDRGRPLTDISHQLDYDELPQDIQQLFSARLQIERRVDRRDGSAHYIVRALPYWTGSGNIEGAVLTFSDVSKLAKAEEQQRVLVAELNHRVKNMLAVIVSIATQTLDRYRDVASFGRAFLARLHALARSHELVSRDQWTAISVKDVVLQEINPFQSEGGNRIIANGPPVSLKPKMALSLGMIVHELGTNATKYGSLSVPDGSVEVSWALEMDSESHLVMDWSERGGPKVKKPDSNGFGLALIEREVTHGLNGKVQFDFDQPGLSVNLRIPLAQE
jgi:two-component system CheB/CheR fusion protein